MNNDAQKENTNVSKKNYRWLKITAIIVVVIILACLFLQIGTWSTHKEEGNFVPDYKKIDISALLDKTELGGEDYDLLYRQTGLTEIGIERELKRGEAGKRKILEIQAAFFTPREVVRKYVAAWMCIDVVRGAAPNVTLETGDIIVSASTHISSLRIGHTGLVVDGEKGEVLQATAYGENTLIGDVTDFTSRINFLVLRPKASAETKQKSRGVRKGKSRGHSVRRLCGSDNAQKHDSANAMRAYRVVRVQTVRRGPRFRKQTDDSALRPCQFRRRGSSPIVRLRSGEEVEQIDFLKRKLPQNPDFRAKSAKNFFVGKSFFSLTKRYK